MKKAINMQAQIHMGNEAGAGPATGAALALAFAAANPGMQLTVKSLAPPDAHGMATVRVYIEGEQDPAADFAALAGEALHRAVAHLNAAPGLQAAPLAVHEVQEVENDDEDTDVVLPPPPAAPPPAPVAAALPPVASPPITPAIPVPDPASNPVAPVPAVPLATAPVADPPPPLPTDSGSRRSRHGHKRGGGHSHSG